MKRAIYHMLVPGMVRERLYKMHLREIREKDAAERRVWAAALPEISLSSGYIRKLQVVIDRPALLWKLPAESVVALIGGADLETVRQLLVVARPVRLHLVDLWDRYGPQHLDTVQRVFVDAVAEGRLVISSGDPVAELSRFPDEYFDWVYLNCRFSYEETYALLDACRVKIKDAGIIAGSNYGTGSWVTGERYGVVEAVNRFCKRHQWEMAFLTHDTARCLTYAIQEMAGTRPKSPEYASNSL